MIQLIKRFLFGTPASEVRQLYSPAHTEHLNKRIKEIKSDRDRLKREINRLKMSQTYSRFN